MTYGHQAEGQGQIWPEGCVRRVEGYLGIEKFYLCQLSHMYMLSMILWVDLALFFDL